MSVYLPRTFRDADRRRRAKAAPEGVAIRQTGCAAVEMPGGRLFIGRTL
jgi:hypothetical protein